MTVDVARAFMEADMERDVCVEIPEEYWKGDRRKLPPAELSFKHVGKLKKSPYGNRDAARNWQEHVIRMMEKWGVREVDATYACFTRKKWISESWCMETTL